MRRVLRVVGAALLVALVPAAGANAEGEPVMPLSQVRAGMQCEVRSVLHGTDVSTFDAEVVDVLAGDPGADAPRILFRFSGPAIERTGVGPGFSGSPIACRGDDGVLRVAAAISESVGEYGGLLALATPIESMLAQPVEPAVRSGAPSRRRAASGQELATPITIAGLSAPVRSLFTRAARRHGRLLLASPAAPRASYPPQELKPGSAVSAGLASGDLTAGAIGTVTYVDDGKVWAFGHPLDDAGRRSLFMQDAYVYAIVNNPVASDVATTYKLAAPGNDVGIISGDGPNAIAGRLGALPDRFPMRVFAKDVDTGRTRNLNVQIADENAIGLPTGASSLSLVGSGAVAQAASSILEGGTPARQSGDMCAQITVRERAKPMTFCNRYVVRGLAAGEEGVGVGATMVSDFATAVGEIDEYNFGTLHVTGVDVQLTVGRGLRQAFLLKATGPKTVRRGGTARVRVTLQEVRGKVSSRVVRVKVPEGIPTGRRALVLEGTPSDESGGLEIDLGDLLFGEEDSAAETGPRSVEALAKSISRLRRYDGVRATFPALSSDQEGSEAAERRANKKRRVLRDPDLRLSGKVRVVVDVR